MYRKDWSGRARFELADLLRPRQARYQAALRPDMKCVIHSKALPNITPNPSHRLLIPDCARTVHEWAIAP